MDIDPERLDFAFRAVSRIVEWLGHYPAKVVATLDRAEALKDADVVLVTILAGGTDVWRYDIEVPKKYGVDINIGDTRGAFGYLPRAAHPSRCCSASPRIWSAIAPRLRC